MAAWEICVQDGGVSESFTHNMAAWGFAYKMAAFLRVLPTRWRRGSFAYKMVAFLRVLPTRWRHGRFAYKMAAMRVSESFTHKMAAWSFDSSFSHFYVVRCH